MLALGPEHRSPTLANFLHDRIMRGEHFEVWSRSTRYPLDVEDAASRWDAVRTAYLASVRAPAIRERMIKALDEMETGSHAHR